MANVPEVLTHPGSEFYFLIISSWKSWWCNINALLLYGWGRMKAQNKEEEKNADAECHTRVRAVVNKFWQMFRLIRWGSWGTHPCITSTIIISAECFFNIDKNSWALRNVTLTACYRFTICIGKDWETHLNFAESIHLSTISENHPGAVGSFDKL